VLRKRGKKLENGSKEEQGEGDIAFRPSRAGPRGSQKLKGASATMKGGRPGKNWTKNNPVWRERGKKHPEGRDL